MRQSPEIVVGSHLLSLRGYLHRYRTITPEMTGPLTDVSGEAIREMLRSPLASFTPWGRAQWDFVLAPEDVVLFQAGNRVGKALPVDEPVLTETGFAPIGSLKIGDRIIGGDGEVCHVTGVFPQGKRPVHRVTFDDGASLRCCEDHLWKVQDSEQRFRKTSGRYGGWSVRPLKEILERWGPRPKPKQRCVIPSLPGYERRAFYAIDPAGVEECVCISVDSSDGTFVAKDFIVTHNTTSLCLRTVMLLMGWHPTLSRRFPPPIKGWLVGLDWEFGVGQVLWPELRKWLPESAIKSIVWWRKQEPSLPSSITLKNGSNLAMKSADSGQSKFMGAELEFCGVDEEVTGDVVEECRARLLRKRGLFYASLTPLKREPWVVNLQRERGTRTVRASMTEAAEAGLLDADAVRRYLDGLSDRQRAVRDRGEHVAIEGLVYPEFSETTHVLRPVTEKGSTLLRYYDGDPLRDRVYPWPLPRSWRRFAAIDFGYANPTAVVLLAQDPDRGTLIGERCYYAPWIRASVWGSLLGQVLPPLTGHLVADHDRQEREELRAVGVETVPARKDIIRGIEAVERRLATRYGEALPGLVLVEDENLRHRVTGRCDCRPLVDELLGYRYPPAPKRVDGPSRGDLPLKRDDHAVDSLRYVISAIDGYAAAEFHPERLSEAFTYGAERR